MSKTINQASARSVMAADDVLLVDDGNNTTDAEKAAFSLLGGLVETAGPDADTTMAMGRLYLVDMSGWSTSRTYTLPAEAKAGERVAILITTGNASHELILQANGAGSPSQTLNGVEGGTEWSRLFITNESVAIRCTTANDAFHVEPGGDGRIPCFCGVTRASEFTFSASTLTTIEWDSEGFDVGDIGSVGSPDYGIKLRRDCAGVEIDSLAIMGDTTTAAYGQLDARLSGGTILSSDAVSDHLTWDRRGKPAQYGPLSRGDIIISRIQINASGQGVNAGWSNGHLSILEKLKA